MTGSEQEPAVRGYVPGVFDMFHVGHLNLITSARPFCDHLIVGVVTDEVVEAVKGKPPVVPLRERMEIVAALRDVDEVVDRRAQRQVPVVAGPALRRHLQG